MDACVGVRRFALPEDAGIDSSPRFGVPAHSAYFRGHDTEILSGRADFAAAVRTFVPSKVVTLEWSEGRRGRGNEGTRDFEPWGGETGGVRVCSVTGTMLTLKTVSWKCGGMVYPHGFRGFRALF